MFFLGNRRELFFLVACKFCFNFFLQWWERKIQLFPDLHSRGFFLLSLSTPVCRQLVMHPANFLANANFWCSTSGSGSRMKIFANWQLLAERSETWETKNISPGKERKNCAKVDLFAEWSLFWIHLVKNFLKPHQGCCLARWQFRTPDPNIALTAMFAE